MAQIVPDSSLGVESSRVTSTSPGVFQIYGGATRGTNLFHSFSQFSLTTNGIAHFNNLNIQNIISRVTGGSVSNIDGLLQANGNANLFLINPNGIIFGPNASLKLGGSFLATTASSVKFADGTQFSATVPRNTPLLTISVPIGLQFGGNPGNIINQSQASPDGATNSIGSPVGLQVQPGQTLALVGGNVTLKGGDLTAASGRTELGSVAGNSLVKLNPIAKGWSLSYEGVQNFQDIQLTQQPFDGAETPSYVDVSGERGGNAQVQGRHVRLTDGSGIFATTLGSEAGGNLTVAASESVELIGSSTLLSAQAGTLKNKGSGNAGDIIITTGKFLVQNGAQVQTGTLDNGSGGQLTVNTSDSVELIGTDIYGTPSILISGTGAAGHGGNLKINTRRLLIQNGAQVSAESSGTGSSRKGNFTPATGGGGDLTVNALDSVELIGTGTNDISTGLFTSTIGAGDAGDLKIATGALIVRDGAAATVSSTATGAAGNLKVSARSIRLDNQGQLTATSASGKKGGEITLQAQDLLVMRRNSQISTTAGTANAGGNGGNITINTPFLIAVPSENSDISANAFRGNGGQVTINAQGIFGTQPQKSDTPLSDITASSTGGGINGVVSINRLNINPSFGLVNLPVRLVDVTELIAQGCPTDVGPRASKFVVTGRGGLPPNPREALRSEPTLVDLGTTVPGQENHASAEEPSKTTNSEPAPLVEATGWVTNAKGEVVLVAQAPTVTLDIPWLTPTTCHAQ